MRGLFIRPEPPGVNRVPSVLTVFREEFEAIEAFRARNVNPFTLTAVILFGLIGVVLCHYGPEVAVRRRIVAKSPRAQRDDRRRFAGRHDRSCRPAPRRSCRTARQKVIVDGA